MQSIVAMLISLINVTKYLLIFNLQNISLVKCYLYTEKFITLTAVPGPASYSITMSNVYGQECLFVMYQSGRWFSTGKQSLRLRNSYVVF